MAKCITRIQRSALRAFGQHALETAFAEATAVAQATPTSDAGAFHAAEAML